MKHRIEDLLEYWESPMDGATGDDAVSDSHSAEHRACAVTLIRAGGPWDEEILGPRPSHVPATWTPMPRQGRGERTMKIKRMTDTELARAWDKRVSGLSFWEVGFDRELCALCAELSRRRLSFSRIAELLGADD